MFLLEKNEYFEEKKLHAVGIGLVSFKIYTFELSNKKFLISLIVYFWILEPYNCALQFYIIPQ